MLRSFEYSLQQKNARCDERIPLCISLWNLAITFPSVILRYFKISYKPPITPSISFYYSYSTNTLNANPFTEPHKSSQSVKRTPNRQKKIDPFYLSDSFPLSVSSLSSSTWARHVRLLQTYLNPLHTDLAALSRIRHIHGFRPVTLSGRSLRE